MRARFTAFAVGFTIALGSLPSILETPEKTMARVSGPCSVLLVSVASELCWRLYECVGPSPVPVATYRVLDCDIRPERRSRPRSVIQRPYKQCRGAPLGCMCCTPYP